MKQPCLIATPYSIFPVPYSLFPIPYSLFPIPYSLLPTPYSLFPIPCSLFTFIKPPLIPRFGSRSLILSSSSNAQGSLADQHSSCSSGEISCGEK
ncbi:MAG: hypothetical protein F6J98_36935 [Moorea sp. SIO4G2]|nr:hypothetical protein [Moorena sp. SIO4G2]